MNKFILKKWLSLSLSSFIFTFHAVIFVNAQQPTPSPVERERVATPQPSPQPSQTPPVVEDDGEVIRVESRLVVVPVSVIDNAGQPVINLTAKDFRLEEEGRTQEITQISSADQVPLEIALLIDVSSSTNAFFEYEKAAAARFLQSVMRQADHASIFLVSNSAVTLQTRETAERTTQTLRNVNPTGKQTQTAFFDSVLAAVDYFRKNAPQNSRRVILSLGDGADNWSSMTREAEKNTWREVDVNTLTQEVRNKVAQKSDAAQRRAQDRVLRELQNGDTVFYSINPAGSSIRLNKIIIRGQEGLQKFADETGGTAFLPQYQPTVQGSPLQSAENLKKNEENLERIFRQIANELRAQYLLQYYSDANFGSGKYVRLNTSLPSKAGLRVKARRGYFATN